MYLACGCQDHNIYFVDSETGEIDETRTLKGSRTVRIMTTDIPLINSHIFKIVLIFIIIIQSIFYYYYCYLSNLYIVASDLPGYAA